MAVDELIGQLSLTDKTTLLTGRTAWKTWPLAKIGLREIVFSDGPVGVRGTGEIPGEVSDCLPSPTALAACWDPDLARRTGRWFAAQARAHGVDVVLAPVVNLQRSPIGGRHFECLSEDPRLTGDIAAALIGGMQEAGVAACVKHFVGNEVETDRTTYSSHIGERALREVYLAPFEQAVRAGVWCVMAAYNRAAAGGEEAAMVAHRHLLADILKGEWGFAGPVVSDWTAVRETVPPALGGLDLVMPGPHSAWSDGALAEAVLGGEVPESLIDDKVRRLLRLASEVGELGNAASLATAAADAGLPRELAARACVVLANRDDALPVARPELIRSVALIGPNAADTRLLGGGSAVVAVAHQISIADGLAQAFPAATVRYREGVTARVAPPDLDLARASVPGTDTPGVLVEFLDAVGTVTGREVRTAWTGVFGDELPQGTAVIHVATAVRLDEPGEHWLGVGTVGRHRVVIDGTEVSVSAHEVGGEVVIDSSFNVPPAHGRAIAVTDARPVLVEAWVQCIRTQWGPCARAGLQHRTPGIGEDAAIAEACALADDADFVCVVVGTNEETESEGWDRRDLRLPGRQDDLVTAVIARRPDALILVNAGAPVVMDWLDQAHTVVWNWFPGQDAGAALADILTGVTEPAGRLPWTLPDTQEHCPVPRGLPDEHGVVDYVEGVDVGYRGWAKSGFAPARAFGFGLGWTTFEVAACRIVRQGADGIDLGVRIRNTGRRRGTDVIEAYLRPPAGPAGQGRPALWLAGYARVEADPGQWADTIVTVPSRAFQTWQPGDGTAGGRWIVPEGTYTIAIGHNAGDLPVTTQLTYVGTSGWGPSTMTMTVAD